MSGPPRRPLGRFAVAAAALAVLAVGGFLGYERLVAAPRLAEEAFQFRLTRAPAPEVALEARDGTPVSLARFRGSVLFVNFWATWCPPCREEMPSMAQLARELERDHPGKFKVIAVSEDDGWPEVDAYFSQTFRGVPKELAVVRDPEGMAAWAFYCGARGACPDIKFPETYIVDREGRMAAFVVSGRDWTDPAARRFLERLIGG